MNKFFLILFTLLITLEIKATINDDFISTWKTDVFNFGGKSIQIPVKSNTIYSYQVDWNGDGDLNDEDESIIHDGVANHTYLLPGTYSIRIVGLFPKIYFINNSYVQSIEQWGTASWESLKFSGSRNIVINALDTPDLSNLTDLSYMFSSARSIGQGNGNWDWNTSNITNMTGMFSNAINFNKPIGSWNTTAVINMSYMFNSAQIFNQPIGSWNTGSVENLNGMFSGAIAFNQDIGLWNTSNVVTMRNLFDYARSFNQDINSWNTTNVTNMEFMFLSAFNFNSPINLWDLSSVTSVEGMFLHAYNFNQSIDEWDISSVINFNSMFYQARAFNQQLNSWVTSSAIDMSRMFYEADNFNQAINSWNTSSVIDMSEIFRKATLFNQPINDWDTSNVKYMSFMFYQARDFNQQINSWDTSSVINMYSMFAYTNNFDQPLNSWNTSSVNNMLGMFANASSFNQPLNFWDVSSVSNMESMFSNAVSFDQDLSSWKIDSVTTFHNMFDNVQLSSENYDPLLISWDAQNSILDRPRELSAGLSKYCSYRALEAKNNMVLNGSWVIDDAGLNPDCNQFVSTWKTDNQGSSNSSSITIPTNPLQSYSYQVDWNGDYDLDDSDESIIYTGDASHDYLIPGTYSIRIVGDFPHIYFNNNGDKGKIISIEQWGDGIWSSFENSFYGATNFENNAFDTPNLSSVVSLAFMFKESTSLGLGGGNWQWNTSNVISMQSMFDGAINFDKDISSWNIENTTNLQLMFNDIKLSTLNYDKLLIEWNNQNLQSNVVFDAGNSQFCLPEAVNSKNQILTNNNWIITDNNKDPFCMSSATAFIISLDGTSNIRIPVHPDEDYLYQVDWNADGDLNDEEESIAHTGMATHNYSTPPPHTFAIVGTFPRINFENISGWITIEQWGITAWTSMENAFKSLYLIMNAKDTPNLSVATSLKSMFESTNLREIGNGNWNWDTSNITDMSDMFSKNYSINPRISSWDTSSVLDMSNMFANAQQFNQNINIWNTSSVKNMNGMFTGAQNFNQPLDLWDTSSVLDMGSMFAAAQQFNQNINSWNTSRVKNMGGMFASALSFNQSLDLWDTSQVTNMSYMFSPTNYFNQIINTWDTRLVIDMSGMFERALEFNQSLDSWDTSSVINMKKMFKDSNFNKPINSWNTNSVTDMSYMFDGDDGFNQPINSWNTSSVTDMGRMFDDAIRFNQPLDNWDTSSVMDMSYMFDSFRGEFNQAIGAWDTSLVVTMNNMFNGNFVFDQDLSNWDFENITNLNSFFDRFGELSSNNYDALLISLANQNLQPGLILDVGRSKYCTVQALEAKTKINDLFGWLLSDSGLNPLCNEIEVKYVIDIVDNTNIVVSGGNITYTILISNVGMEEPFTTHVYDVLPVEIISTNWFCEVIGNAICSSQGVGQVNENVTIPIGDSIMFTVSALLSEEIFENITYRIYVNSAIEGGLIINIDTATDINTNDTIYLDGFD